MTDLDALTRDVPYREREASIDLATYESAPGSEELLTLNFGPHHPATQKQQYWHPPR